MDLFFTVMAAISKKILSNGTAKTPRTPWKKQRKENK
jgi:hypothetical protein